MNTLRIHSSLVSTMIFPPLLVKMVLATLLVPSRDRERDRETVGKEKRSSRFSRNFRELNFRELNLENLFSETNFSSRNSREEQKNSRSRSRKGERENHTAYSLVNPYNLYIYINECTTITR